ncbi:hypothetical protein JCM3770_003993 [Rhodotorula araucariae]
MDTCTDAFSPQTVAPAALTSTSTSTSSRPSTPHRRASASAPAVPEFDPAAYLDLHDLPTSMHLDPAALGAPPVPFATGSSGMTRTGSSSSGGGSATGGGGGGASAGGRGMRTRLRTGALPQTGAGGGFVSFDPDDGGIDLDDVSDDDDRAIEGRPRKRKSVRDLRGAAQSQAASTAAAAAAPVKDEGGGDDDKTRRKISIEYIEEKSKRHITFSKRKAGIMKKAYELSTLTGTQVLLLVVSESGWVYTFTTDKFKPLVKEDENGQLSAGQKLIAACLEAKDGAIDLSAAYPAAASTSGNFEANSSQHGGQISLRTGARARPVATNRRVSSRGRAHVPAAIQTGSGGGGPVDPTLPCPPGSGGIPPVPQLPTPLSSTYLDAQMPMHSPISPRGGPNSRGVSHPPISPARPGYSLQQQQQHAHAAQQQAEYAEMQQADYAEMMQRADMLHLQQQQQQQQQGGYAQDYDLYGQPHGHNLYLQDLPLPPPPPHLRQHHGGGHHAHALHRQPSLDTLPQPPTLHHSRSFSHGGGGGVLTPHRTLHHQASHGHLGGGYASGGGGAAEYAGGNYTHAPAPGMAVSSSGGTGGSGGGSGAGGDLRQGWQTPQHHGCASAQGTPVHGLQQAQSLYAGGA